MKNPPKSWADLEKPEYKGQVAIDGNPGSAGDAFAAVFSAALAMGGSLDNIMPGLEYFAAPEVDRQLQPDRLLPGQHRER